MNNEVGSEVNDEASTQDCSEDNFAGNFKLRFEHTFCQMQPQDKWYLSNGKCVEDELCAFGMQCSGEHSCHLWILDIDDSSHQ